MPRLSLETRAPPNNPMVFHSFSLLGFIGYITTLQSIYCLSLKFWQFQYLLYLSFEPPKQLARAIELQMLAIWNEKVVISISPSNIWMTLLSERLQCSLRDCKMHHSSGKLMFFLLFLNLSVMFFLSIFSNSAFSTCWNVYCDSRICLMYFLFCENQYSSLSTISIINISTYQWTFFTISLTQGNQVFLWLHNSATLSKKLTWKRKSSKFISQCKMQHKTSIPRVSNPTHGDGVYRYGRGSH